jgi:hypothetical protein
MSPAFRKKVQERLQKRLPLICKEVASSGWADAVAKVVDAVAEIAASEALRPVTSMESDALNALQSPDSRVSDPPPIEFAHCILNARRKEIAS